MIRSYTLMYFDFIVILITITRSSAFDTAITRSSLNCDDIRSFFEIQGFSPSDIPKESISSKELKTCGSKNSGGEVCCSADMELKLQSKALDKHDKATRDTLQRLQNILHIRAIRFHNFFNDLLNSSKRSFHEMFKKTYGILYEQNADVFIELFQELEKYYIKGSVDLDDVMDTFFNTLYQKMFTVLNSQYKFDNKYLECVGLHMKEMMPFGDVPQKLSVQIKRSFIATRAFSQALQVASEVLKNMQQLKSTNECISGLTRMTVCPSCSGVSNKVLACNDMCENIMKGCLAQHAALDADWNHFVEAVDKVAERLLGPFNIEMLVRPINLKISEAIMNFQESSNNVSQRVFTGCGRPVLGRRRRRRRDIKDVSDHRSLKFDVERETSEEENDDHGSSAIILDKLVKEIKQRIRDSRQFWLYLPYKLCTEGLVVSNSKNNVCWNGTHIDKYIYPLSSNGEVQNLNPEVQAFGPRTAVVREQIFALNSISNRLRSAFNGHDVDWIDTDENWTSGNGSGSGSSVDSITDDEDDLGEESSGLEVTSITDPNLIKSKDFEEQSVPPIKINEIELTPEDKPDLHVNHKDNIFSNNTKTQVPVDSGATTVIQRISLSKALMSYLLPIIVVWFSGCLTKWL